MGPRWLTHLALLATLAAVYFVTAKLSLQLAFFHPSATPVWPPTGITLAAFLLLGYRVWPGIFLGAFLVNLVTEGTMLTSLGIGAGNTLEGVVGAYLVARFANGRWAFERARDVFTFALVAAGASTLVSATFGVTSLALGGFANWTSYGSIWFTWWLGDAAGDLIVAPAIILWSTEWQARWTTRQLFEAGALVLGLGLVGALVFGGLFPEDRPNPLAFLSLPFFVWSAYRFSQRETAAAVVLFSGIAIWGTLRGFGPFMSPSPNESFLLLQAFMGTTGVVALSLGAAVSERRRLEEHLRRLAVSDPVTGLANYRGLTQALTAEIERTRRNGRQFAILFLDLDGLKRINDRHGHLVGSRALCRLADALRRSSRATDTAARVGGDEFALILSHADEAAARAVAGRVAVRLADGQEPPVTASVGMALYPRDGDTMEALLGAADLLLYDAKAQRSAGRPRMTQTERVSPPSVTRPE